MLKALRFENLLLVVLIFGLAWCHVMEIAGKRRFDPVQWLVVQHNLCAAFGWLYAAFGGPVPPMKGIIAG
jgi:hypothetical protein